MFSSDKVKPANEKAKLLAECVIKLLKANNELEDAISRVPSYTAQWSDEDFYAREQEDWNRAADELYSVVSTTQ